MDFKNLTMENDHEVARYRAESPRELSEYSRAYTAPWASRDYSIDFAETAGCCILRYHFRGMTYYSSPFGAGDRKAALAALEALAPDCEICPITAEEAAALGPGWLVREDPDWCDYVYRAQDLAELKGSKYQAKRNFCHRFESLGPWEYLPITTKRIADVHTILAAWKDHKTGNPGDDAELVTELTAIERILPDLSGYVGGVLYSNGRPVAFSFGERVSPRMILVAYEKALPDVVGAFAMVNREFVRHFCRAEDLVNRAGADGHPNLVKAKESYHPCLRLGKFSARHLGVRTARPEDRETLVHLWQESFGDPRGAIDFFLDRYLSTALLIGSESMCFALPQADGTRYIYALCTTPAARGKGNAAKLLEAAAWYHECPLALVPSEDQPTALAPSSLLLAPFPLIPFYEHLGFAVSSPAAHRQVKLNDWQETFYRLCGKEEGAPVFTDAPTLTRPLLAGYQVTAPLD